MVAEEEVVEEGQKHGELSSSMQQLPHDAEPQQECQVLTQRQQGAVTSAPETDVLLSAEAPPPTVEEQIERYLDSLCDTGALSVNK